MTKKSIIGSIVCIGILVILVIIVLGSIGGKSSQGDLYYDEDFSYGESAGVDSLGIAGAGLTEQASKRTMVAPAPTFDTSASDDTTQGQERLIIKTGTIAIVVEEVGLAVEQVQRFAESHNGFVVSSNAYNTGIAPRAEITIRVPVETFDAAVTELEGIGKVESKTLNGQDVTEEFVDLEAQVRNLERTEAQFLEIMARAVKIEDVLAVQRELSTVRSQIERLQGRMNYLSKSAQLSTLTVYLSTNPEALPVIDENTWKPLAVAKNAFRSLIGLGQGVANGFIWLVVYLPLWIVLFLVGLFVYKRVARMTVEK